MEVAAKTNQIIDTLSPEEADFLVIASRLVPAGSGSTEYQTQKWALNPGRVCPFFIRFPLCGPGILITD